MKIRVKSNNLLLIFLALIMGITFAVSFVLHGAWQVILIVLLCICLFASVLHIRKFYKKPRIILLFAVLMLTGYLLSCIYMSSFSGRVKTGDITPAEINGGTAVLLLSPGEIDLYDSHSAIYRLKSCREAGLGGVRWWNIPFKAQQLKRSFNSIDGETCILTGQNLFDKLKAELGDRFELYCADLFGSPFIETVVDEILKKGYDKIIVLNNLLVEMPFKEVIDKKIIGVIEKSGNEAEVLFTFPLWNHDGIVSLYEQRILEKTQEISPEQVGVILVARGFDRKTQKEYPQAFDRAEVFYNKIKESLVKNGYDGRKIRIAYIGHRQSGVKDTLDYLLDYGINKLVIAAVGFESTGIETEYIIPRLAESRKLPENVGTVFIGPWGDSDYLVDALLDRLEMVNER